MRTSVIVIVFFSICIIAAIAVLPLTVGQNANNAYGVPVEDYVVSSEVGVRQSAHCTRPDTCPVTLLSESAKKAPISTSSNETLSVSREVTAPSEDKIGDIEPLPETPIAVVEEVTLEPAVAVAVEEVVAPDTEDSDVAVATEIEDTPADDFISVLAAEIHRLTNNERASAGLPALEYDTELAVIAELHSRDMADNEYFSHTAAGDCDLACRYDAADYEAQAWGENIAWRSADPLPDAPELAAFFVNEWMDSPGHRRNILLSSFTHEGVGLARIGNKVYATVNFSRPR